MTGYDFYKGDVSYNYNLDSSDALCLDRGVSFRMSRSWGYGVEGLIEEQIRAKFKFTENRYLAYFKE